jgi:hypothetical protein
MLASVTRLRVGSLLKLPAFLWMTIFTQRQIVRAPGLMGGVLLLDRRRAFWTLTVWENEKAMRAFRGSGAHARAMPKLAQWCDEAAYAHWESTGDSIPPWTEAYERLASEGKLSRVAHPSEDHLARRFPEPRLKPLMGQALKPVAGRTQPAA